MNIIIDTIIFFWQHSGGISVVWSELIKRFLINSLCVRYLTYDRRVTNSFYNNLNIPSELLIQLTDKYLFLKRYLPIKIPIQKQPFIFHSTYYRLCKNKNAINIITVHDFVYDYYRHGLSKLVHCLNKYYAIKNADYIICVSENTKKDLMKFVTGIDEEKIKVIYNGVDGCFRVLDHSIRNNIASGKFLLFVGGRKGYKNFKIAVKTAQLAKMQLFIVGKKLSKHEVTYVKKYLKNNYKDFGFVSCETLNLLYNKAFALIYPSSYEGFGIPVIEAQKAGCPVLAVNKSSIPEIIGNVLTLVDYEDENLFYEKIRLLEDNVVREKIIADGLINSRRFSWNKAYKEYVQLYERIMDGKK